MKILKGGTAELPGNKWKKFDLELDESDLQALTVKYGLANLTVVQKYQLLTKQANVLVTVEMESEGLQGEKSARELMEDFNNYVDKLPKVE